jgi:hypothetical protein
MSAFRIMKPEFATQARIEALQPHIEAIVRQNACLGSDQATISARIDYVIKRSGVFGLRVALPEDYRVESITGENLAQWVEKNTLEGRVVEVALKERILGAYALNVQLSRSHNPMSAHFQVVGVHPLGVQKLTGLITVATEGGVMAKTASFDGMTEIPASTAVESAADSSHATAGTSTSSALAFKYLNSEPVPVRPSWKLTVNLESVEPWIRAEVVNWVKLSESLVSGRSRVRFDIQNAPVKEFRIRVPDTFKNVEVSGQNIRRRDQNGAEWRIELQSKVMGSYLLTVNWEQPFAVRGSSTELTLSGVQALGVERETGSLAVMARPPLQVEGKSVSGDWIKQESTELPVWVTDRGEDITLAYRYLRPNSVLTLIVQRYQSAEVLQALVDNAVLTTVLADDGQWMTTLNLSVRYNARQYLSLVLPPGVQIWSAFVAGKPVRPCVKDGALLVPLEKVGGEDSAASVELTYVSTNYFPKTMGKVRLVSPSLDVPVKNARWELFLPPDYRYDDFEGSMKYETTEAPVLQSFSFSEYSQLEKRNVEEKRKENAFTISKARQELSRGNVKFAASMASRYYRSGITNASDDKDNRQLQVEINRAQSSNLIQAQNEFSTRNSEQLGGTSPGKTNPALRAADIQAAEQQWNKLQQAQEVAAMVVRPIRVNLPTRGLRYNFSQALQTELNKPMTVQFTAENHRTPHWLQRGLLALAAFLVLWTGVAATVPRRPL